MYHIFISDKTIYSNSPERLLLFHTKSYFRWLLDLAESLENSDMLEIISEETNIQNKTKMEGMEKIFTWQH